MIETSLKGFGKLPEPIENAPELYPWLHPYYKAFEELMSDRENGMGIGYIPWTAINEYAKRHPLLEFDFDQTLYYIRVLDFAYVKWVREQEKKSDKSGNKTKPKPPRRQRYGR